MNQETKQENDENVELRSLINDVQEGETNQQHFDPEQDTNKVKSAEEENVDILNLPPRKTVHEQNKKRLKFKLNLPLIRFMLVLLVVIGLLITVLFVFGEQFQDNLINTDGLFSIIRDLSLKK